jgi:multidrug resistance efflux pump
MSKLEPIPIPAAARWEDWRTRWLPVGMFVICVGAVVVLWMRVGSQGTLSGVGEGRRSLMASPQAGYVAELLVAPYQVVRAGDPLVVVHPVDPRSSMDVLRSRLDLAALEARPGLAEENAMNYERVRIELLNLRSDLAVARVELEMAERDVVRQGRLFEEQVIAESLHELSALTRDMRAARVEELTRAVAQVEERMRLLESLGDPFQEPGRDGLTGTLQELRATLSEVATHLEPVTLRAPFAGMVGTIHRQQGEFIVQGDALVTLNSLWSDRIVGYLRQPYSVDPVVGMPVRVTTRTGRKREFWSEITKVGTHLEMITNALTYIRPGTVVDAGLPIVVDLPSGVNVRAGEVVDLMIAGEESVVEAGGSAETPGFQPAGGSLL